MSAELNANEARDLAAQADPSLAEQLQKRMDAIFKAITSAAKKGETSMSYEYYWGDWASYQDHLRATPFWPGEIELTKLRLLGYRVKEIAKQFADSGNGYEKLVISW